MFIKAKGKQKPCEELPIFCGDHPNTDHKYPTPKDNPLSEISEQILRNINTVKLLTKINSGEC